MTNNNRIIKWELVELCDCPERGELIKIKEHPRELKLSDEIEKKLSEIIENKATKHIENKLQSKQIDTKPRITAEDIKLLKKAWTYEGNIQSKNNTKHKFTIDYNGMSSNIDFICDDKFVGTFEWETKTFKSAKDIAEEDAAWEHHQKCLDAIKNSKIEIVKNILSNLIGQRVIIEYENEIKIDCIIISIDGDDFIADDIHTIVPDEQLKELTFENINKINVVFK